METESVIGSPWIERGWTCREGDYIVHAHVGADGYSEKRVYAPRGRHRRGRPSWWRRLWEWLTR